MVIIINHVLVPKKMIIYNLPFTKKIKRNAKISKLSS